MTSPLRAARAAFIFLTRVPVGGFPFTPEEWRGASAFFPLVGAGIGAVTSAIFVSLRPLGAAAAALLAVGASLLVTGAFHEDGLADTSDALGGAYDREKLFVILKDSRIGTFGASALVLSIAGRAALVAQLDGRAAWALVLAGVLARAAPVWQMVLLPYATPKGGKSRELTRAGPAQALIASAWPIALGVALVATHSFDTSRIMATFLAVAVLAGVTGWRYTVRAGGITGDFLGATEQLGELAILAVLAWG